MHINCLLLANNFLILALWLHSILMFVWASSCVCLECSNLHLMKVLLFHLYLYLLLAVSILHINQWGSLFLRSYCSTQASFAHVYKQPFAASSKQSPPLSLVKDYTGWGLEILLVQLLNSGTPYWWCVSVCLCMRAMREKHCKRAMSTNKVEKRYMCK